MIEKLKLKNFQSHKETSFNFHKNVNVIIGETDSGKSSVERAIELLTLNRMSGNNLVSHNQENLEIEGVFDGVTVKRIKGKDNLYYYENNKLSAIGKGLPIKIKDLGFSCLNFHSQLDSHYLVFDTGGEAAKKINEVIDISLIDCSNRLADKKLRKLKNVIEVQKNEISNAENELEKYKNVLSIKRKIMQIKAKERRLENENKRLLGLRNIISELNIIEKEKGKHYFKITNKKKIEGIRVFCEEHKEREVAVNKLKTIIEIKKQIEKLTNKISFKSKIENIIKKEYKTKTIGIKILGIKKILQELKTIKEYKKNTLENIRVIISKLPEACPTCKQLIR